MVQALLDYVPNSQLLVPQHYQEIDQDYVQILDYLQGGDLVEGVQPIHQEDLDVVVGGLDVIDDGLYQPLCVQPREVVRADECLECLVQEGT